MDYPRSGSRSECSPVSGVPDQCRAFLSVVVEGGFEAYRQLDPVAQVGVGEGCWVGAERGPQRWLRRGSEAHVGIHDECGEIGGGQGRQGTAKDLNSTACDPHSSSGGGGGVLHLRTEWPSQVTHVHAVPEGLEHSTSSS